MFRRLMIVILATLFVFVGLSFAQRGGSKSSPSVSRPAPSKPSVPVSKAPVANQQQKQNIPQANTNTKSDTKSAPTYNQPAPSARPAPRPPSKPLVPLNQTGDIKTAPNATPNYANKPFKQLSQSDQKLLRDAKTNGTLFKSRDEAASDFKSRYSNQYQSKFTAEPTARPAYIPQTYVNAGNTYNVIYNPSFGGYGYTNSLGAFILYDAMSDAIMMNHLMNHHGYAHGMDPSQVVVHRDSGYGTIAIAVILLLFVVIIAVIFFKH